MGVSPETDPGANVKSAETDAGESKTWPGQAGGDAGAGGNDAGGQSGGQDAAKPDAGNACAGAVSTLAFGFESGSSGFTHASMDGVVINYPLDEWAVGTSTLPTGCYSGSGCFATHLSKNYAQCTRAELVSPAMDLSACSAQNVILAFEHAYAFRSLNFNGQMRYDGGIVEFSNDGGNTWQKPPATNFPGVLNINPSGDTVECLNKNGFYVHGKAGYTGSSGGWKHVEIAIPQAFRTANFKVRFAVAAGVSSNTTDAEQSRSYTDAGWTIDDVRVEVR